MDTSERRVKLGPGAADRVRGGHRLVPPDWIGGRDRLLPAGQVVSLVDDRGAALGAALADGSEKLAFRVLPSRPEGAPLGPEWLDATFSEASRLREALIDRERTDCYRLLNGEADGLGGLCVDVYGRYLVAQVYSAGLLPHLEAIASSLERLFSPAGLYLADRSPGPAASRSDEARGRLLRGKPAPRDLTVQEDGVLFRVDLAGGYDTGLFLDNRENRLALRRYARGRSVLNLFSYTGSISVHAALAGASQVVSVDISARVQSWARKNFALNGLAPDDYAFIREEALDYLRRLSHRGVSHGLIVADPPSFSTSKKGVFSSARDYTALLSLCLDVLAPGGILVACSNRAAASAGSFLGELASVSARKGRPLRLLEMRGAGPDFPVLPVHPETAHLKVAVLAG